MLRLPSPQNTPYFMTMVDLNQRSQEWLDWRKKGITASDIPIILGLSPYKTPWQLWAEKTGFMTAPDISNNPNVRRGNALEDDARQLMETRYKDILLPMCGEYTHWPVLRASFDGLDENLRPFEFKAPSDTVWNDVFVNGSRSKTYQMYEAQVHAQCLVSGQSEGRLVFYRECGEFLDFKVSLSDALKATLLSTAQQFWECIVNNTAPELDPEKDWYLPNNGDDQFRWKSYAEIWCKNQHRIKTLKDQLKDMEKDQKAIQKHFIELMGPFMKTDLHGIKVSRYAKQGHVDYKALLDSLHPGKDLSKNMEEFRKPSRTECRFSLSEVSVKTVEVVPQSSSSSNAINDEY